MPGAERERGTQLRDRHAGRLNSRRLVATKIIRCGFQIGDRIFEILDSAYNSRMRRGFASHGLRIRGRHGGGDQKTSGQGAVKGVLEALRDTDVRNVLNRISAPTLVLHRRGDRAVRIGAGRHLASHIAHAQFVELDGADHWAFAGDQQPIIAGTGRFVGDLKTRV